MLDHLQTNFQTTNPQAPTDWHAGLTWGHIVLFRFPVRLPGETDNAKVRPCLVLDVEMVGAQRCALIAYGTSADTKANRGYEIDVRGEEATAVGLHKPTRFVGARRILVPLEHPGFLMIGDSGSPIVGRLTGQSLDRMNAVRGRIHAEADMAKARLFNRRTDWRKSARGRPFTLERKSRQKPAGVL
jgi:hypothetical protein